MQRGCLSKNLLRMKFMQRSAMEAEKQQSLADHVITSEEWRYEPDLLAGLPRPPMPRVVYRPDYLPVCGGPLGAVLPLQPAGWGRVSYGGFNPVVEKLMTECGRAGGGGGSGGVNAAELEAEAGATVTAEQLQTRRRQRGGRGGGGLTASLDRKFDTKRARKRRLAEAEAAVAGAESPPEEGELDEDGGQQPPLTGRRKREKKLRKKQQQQKSSSKGRRQLKPVGGGRAVLPHPSSLLAGRKRKAEPDG